MIAFRKFPEFASGIALTTDAGSIQIPHLSVIWRSREHTGDLAVHKIRNRIFADSAESPAKHKALMAARSLFVNNSYCAAIN
ncbi:hypothetical protein C5H23_03485 [Xylella fastidiosa]|nr:hypothetical protein C5H23_03485 [Xylella fastidiosa]TNV99966.1 hypothetical protein C5H21_02415 [Xylella fastidiosa]